MTRTAIISIIALIICTMGAQFANAAEWTFLVYMDVDNNIESQGLAKFMEMARVGSDANINVVVQMDRHDQYDTGNDDWTTCKRFRVTSGMEPNESSAVEDLGEVNMGDKETLRAFIDWTADNYPAEKYALILKNHGGGWNGFGYDLKDETGDLTGDGDEGYLEVREIRQALEDAKARMDLIGFDACLMGMIEVAYELAKMDDEAKVPAVMVGSEEESIGGLRYDLILTDLVNNPTATPAQLGTFIVDHRLSDDTLAAIDLTKISSLTLVLNDLANLMGDERSSTDDVKNKAKKAMAEIDKSIIQENHSGRNYNGARGLSILFPMSSDEYNEWDDKGYYEGDFAEEEKNLKFVQDTLWDEFLIKFYTFPMDSWIYIAREASQIFSIPPKFAGRGVTHVDLYDFCYQLSVDQDNDGLPDALERTMCTTTNPLDVLDGDTDDDGILDGDEDSNHNGRYDWGETDPCNPDTDGDGIQDGTEIGLTLNDIGPDTNTDIFKADEDPTTHTDPILRDSDHDGLADGEEDLDGNGQVDPGEQDPAFRDTCDYILHYQQVPAGQSAAYETECAITAGPDYTIQSGAIVTFEAGGTIRLLPGFHSASGSVFSAVIVQ